MNPFTALIGGAAGTHAADQMALATLPLTATLVIVLSPLARLRVLPATA